VTPIDWSEGLALRIGPYDVGLTETSPETAGYWEGVAHDELRIKRCQGCGRHLHPRRIFCPQCRSHELAWVRAGGAGTVYTFSTVYRSPSPEFEAPYTNGIVELAEGVHLFGRLIGKDHDRITIGDKVQAEFGAVVPGGDRLALFRVR
jgi:uncharacterized protein